jgi:hypothetical protein
MEHNHLPLVADERVHRVLLHLRTVRDLPDEGGAPDRRAGGMAAGVRFSAEIRATGAASCCHTGAIAGGFVPPILPGTPGGLVSFVTTLFFSPETKGQVLVPDLQIAVPGE